MTSAETRNNSMLLLAIIANSGSLKRADHPNGSVWLNLFVLNIFTALKGTHFYVFIMRLFRLKYAKLFMA